MKYTSRRGEEYFLYTGKDKNGKERPRLALKVNGTPLDEVPPGYEIYEHPDGRVFLRKRLVSLLTDEEVQVVRDGLAAFSPLKHYQYKLDLGKKGITLYELDDTLLMVTGRLDPGAAGDDERIAREAQRYGSYGAVMRFVLVDEKKRVFEAQRFCFLGSIDDWIQIGRRGALRPLVGEFVRHLGQESLFELV